MNALMQSQRILGAMYKCEVFLPLENYVHE